MRSMGFTCPNLSHIFRPPPAVSSAEPRHRVEVPAIDPILSDVTCAIYNGGRVDGLRGMEVVAHVIQNRANHPAFPSDPQGVVLAGPEQFVHKHLGAALLHSVLEKQLFDQARRLATQLVYPPRKLLTADPTGGALYYDRRGPVWLHSISRPTGLSSRANSVERAGESSGVDIQRRAVMCSSGSTGSAVPSRSVSRAHSCTSHSSESDGDNFSPPCSPRPERPNRSRRPFSFLRERSVASFSRLYRRSEGSVTPSSGNDPDQTRSSGRPAAHSRRESRRRSVPGSLIASGLPHRLHSSTMRLGEQTTFGLGRTSPTRDGDMILPCGLFQEEVIDLMYRDLSPEDFEMLSKLDERLPKRNTAHSNLIDILPRVSGKDCGVSECRVCLAEVEPSTLLAKLPCQHCFHPGCISKWLTQCKNTCPLCSKPIEGCKESLASSRKGDAPSTTLHREERAQRQIDSRPLPLSIPRGVQSLHL